jgi:hypothetical protein
MKIVKVFQTKIFPCLGMRQLDARQDRQDERQGRQEPVKVGDRHI